MPRAKQAGHLGAPHSPEVPVYQQPHMFREGKLPNRRPRRITAQFFPSTRELPQRTFRQQLRLSQQSLAGTSEKTECHKQSNNTWPDPRHTHNGHMSQRSGGSCGTNATPLSIQLGAAVAFPDCQHGEQWGREKQLRPGASAGGPAGLGP